MTVSNRTVTRRELKPIGARQVEARSRAKGLRVRVYEVEAQNCYATRSQSEADTVYHVTRESDGWHCECKGYFFTGCCKHLAQVERRSEREGWTFGKIARHK